MCNVNFDAPKNFQLIVLKLLKTPGDLLQTYYLELESVGAGVPPIILPMILEALVQQKWVEAVTSERTGLVFAYRITLAGARAKRRLANKLRAVRVATES